MLEGAATAAGSGVFGVKEVARVDVQAPRSILSKSKTPSWVVVKPEQSGACGDPQGLVEIEEDTVAVKEQSRVEVLHAPCKVMVLPSTRVYEVGAERFRGVLRVVQVLDPAGAYDQLRRVDVCCMAAGGLSSRAPTGNVLEPEEEAVAVRLYMSGMGLLGGH